MTVVVETGNGLTEANSYIDSDYLEDYFSAERKAKWNNKSQDEQDSLLVSATQFIDLSYKWIGKCNSHEQGLSWPRTGAVYPDTNITIDGVPKAVHKATAETVAILLDGSTLFEVIKEAQVKRERLAVLETEYFEAKQTLAEGETIYPLLNLILAGLYETEKPHGSGINSTEVLRA